jgi:hypothetical protein
MILRPELAITRQPPAARLPHLSDLSIEDTIDCATSR